MPSTTAAATSERSVGIAGPSRQVPLLARVDPTRGDPVRVGVGAPGTWPVTIPCTRTQPAMVSTAHMARKRATWAVRTGACPFLHWR